MLLPPKANSFFIRLVQLQSRSTEFACSLSKTFHMTYLGFKMLLMSVEFRAHFSAVLEGDGYELILFHSVLNV